MSALAPEIIFRVQGFGEEIKKEVARMSLERKQLPYVEALWNAFLVVFPKDTQSRVDGASFELGQQSGGNVKVIVKLSAEAVEHLVTSLSFDNEERDASESRRLLSLGGSRRLSVDFALNEETRSFVMTWSPIDPEWTLVVDSDGKSIADVFPTTASQITFSVRYFRETLKEVRSEVGLASEDESQSREKIRKSPELLELKPQVEEMWLAFTKLIGGNFKPLGCESEPSSGNINAKLTSSADAVGVLVKSLISGPVLDQEKSTPRRLNIGGVRVLQVKIVNSKPRTGSNHAARIHIQKAPLQRDWTVVASDWEKGLIPKMVSGNAVSRITFRITGFQKALKSESPELRPFEFLWTAFSKMTKCEREAEFFTAEHGNAGNIDVIVTLDPLATECLSRSLILGDEKQTANGCTRKLSAGGFCVFPLKLMSSDGVWRTTDIKFEWSSLQRNWEVVASVSD